MEDALLLIIELAIGVVLSLSILRRPYLGFVYITASLPVADILPSLPFVSSVTPLMGGITLIAFLLARKYDSSHRKFHFSSVHGLGLLLIIWIFITNPEAAWSGLDRNWMFTFIQLIVLLWLAGELLDTPQKQTTLMWVFCITSVISASIAILQGSIGQDVDASLRVAGLAEGANTAARYFVVAMVFLIYLRINAKKRIASLVANLGLIISIIGLFFTVSRTGIVLLFTAIGLMILLQPQLKYRFQVAFLLVAIIVMLWLYADNLVAIVATIVPSVIQGTDTVGLRFGLWEAGWQMWLDNPIQGVGIGRFGQEIGLYGQGLIPQQFLNYAIVPHNMYIAMLSETGLVGSIIFLILLIKTIFNLWRVAEIHDSQFSSLRNVWFVVFIVMLVGGLTKTDHVDKMLWLTMGIGVFFQNRLALDKLESADDEIKRIPDTETLDHASY